MAVTLTSRLLLGVSVVGLVMSGGSAFTQEIELDSIVVYGEKTERNLQETTTSVQVFTQEDIERSTIEDIDDILDQSANVNSRFGGEGFAIRGINNAQVAGGGQSPLATLYVDGAPISGFAVRTGIEELWDVGQVEILRGPQSTTQGRNTLAGAIIVTTNNPVYENQMAFRGGGGTQDYANASGMINASVIDDVLAFRFSADYQTTDGFNSNPTLGIDDQAFQRSLNLRAKMLFEPTSQLSNIVTFTYAENESGDDEVNGLAPFRREFLGNIQGFEDTLQIIAAMDSTYTINDNWYLKNTFTYNNAAYDRLDDNSPFIFDDPNSFFRDNVTGTITEEFRIHYESETTRAHLGAYYANIDFDDASGGVTEFTDAQLQDFGVNPAILPLYSGLTINADRTFDRGEDNYAIFGEVAHDFSDFFTLTAGFRYDRVDFTSISTDERTLLTALPGPCGIIVPPGVDLCLATNAGLLALLNQPDDPGSSATSEAFLPNIGVTFNWTEDLSTSFFVKRGYRAGGSGTSLVTFTPFQFDPEFVWNYEASVRSQWFDDRLTINANAFYMDWTDQQVLTPGPSGPLDSVTVNAGKSELYGFEVEAFARPTDNLRLRGSVGYVHTEFTEFLSNGVDLTGNEFPNAPEWTVAASARYDFDNGYYIQGDINYRSRAFSDPENLPGSFEDERTLVNAKAGYRNANWDVYIYSTNIFDVDYITNTSALTPNSTKVGDGRFIGARVVWKN